MEMKPGTEGTMITYADSVDGITPEMLRGFFQDWKRPRSPESHLRILRNSDYVVLAVDSETQRVVGFVTAITDHVQSAFIPLLEVLPEYQNQGIGTELVNRMLGKLEEIPSIDLCYDPPLQPFYERLGMARSVGMMIYHY